MHTADIHLDHAYATLGLPPARGNENRVHLQAVLLRILDRARERGAGAVVITGDLFEHDRVTRGTVNFLRDAFAALDPIPVFLCPGRHDRCIAGSPYLTEQWTANVHVFAAREWEAVALPAGPVTIHGFGWDGAAADGTLPAPLEIPQDGRTHLAFGYGMEGHILHGARLEAARFDPAFTLPRGLAYLGLGEFHTARAIAGSYDTPVWFAGAPEGHGFDDQGPHTYLELDVDADGQVAVTPQTASEGRFHRIVLDCSRFNSGQELLDAVRGAMSPHRADQYVRLTLEGSLLRQIYDELDGIRDVLLEEVCYLQWHDTCQVGEDHEAIAREHTSLGAFAARLNQEIADAPTHALRLQRSRSRDLGICAYRGTALPVRGLTGEYR